jgi:hypothetical protein
MPTGAMPSTDTTTQFTRRAPAAAGEEHPRAKGLARAVAAQRRATRGGALDACPNANRTTLRRKWHLHVHVIAFVSAEGQVRRRPGGEDRGEKGGVTRAFERGDA